MTPGKSLLPRPGFASPVPVTNQHLVFGVYGLWPTRREMWLEFCMSGVCSGTLGPHICLSLLPLAAAVSWTQDGSCYFNF